MGERVLLWLNYFVGNPACNKPLLLSRIRQMHYESDPYSPFTQWEKTPKTVQLMTITHLRESQPYMRIKWTFAQNNNKQQLGHWSLHQTKKQDNFHTLKQVSWSSDQATRLIRLDSVDRLWKSQKLIGNIDYSAFWSRPVTENNIWKSRILLFRTPNCILVAISRSFNAKPFTISVIYQLLQKGFIGRQFTQQNRK